MGEGWEGWWLSEEWEDLRWAVRLRHVDVMPVICSDGNLVLMVRMRLFDLRVGRGSATDGRRRLLEHGKKMVM